MTYKIRYTPEAQRDMDRIWDDVLETSKDYDITSKYLKEMRNAISKKGKAPKTGTPLYYCGLFTGYYHIRFKAYTVFYRIEDDRMEVAHVIPVKRDYMVILFGEE